MEKTINAFDIEDTTPDASIKEKAEPNTTVDAPQSTENSNGSAFREQGEEAPFLTVKFNHERIGLSSDEATVWAQKGMKYEGLYEKLRYLSALQNTTPEHLAERLIEEHESGYRKKLEEEMPGAESQVIEDLMTLYRRRALDFTAGESLPQNPTQHGDKHEGDRLICEFEEMKRDFPELVDIGSLPQEVKDDAADGKPLLDAYLCYRHREAMRVKKNETLQKAAGLCSAGSMSGAGDTQGDCDRRYLSSLWANKY